MCHSLEPRKTAANATTISTQPANPPAMRRRRRSRRCRARAVRVLRWRRGPTATGCDLLRRPPVSHLPASLSSAEGAALVEPALQDHHRRRLVDDTALTSGAHTRLPQRSLRADGGQPLVGQTHRNRGYPARQHVSQSRSRPRRLADAVGQGQRQTDDHLDRVEFGDQLGQPAQVAAGMVAANRLHRGRQYAVGVAAGHTDAPLAHVDTEPPTPAGIVRAGPVGLTVLCSGHSGNPRYLCPDGVQRSVDTEAYPSPTPGPGRLYLRRGPRRPQRAA